MKWYEYFLSPRSLFALRGGPANLNTAISGNSATTTRA
jgi:hypothetical protein